MKYSFVVKSLLVVLFSLTLTACDDDDKSVVIPRSEDPSGKDASNSNSSASADDTLKRHIPRSEDPSGKDASNSNSSASADDTLKRQKDIISKLIDFDKEYTYTEHTDFPSSTNPLSTMSIVFRSDDTIEVKQQIKSTLLNYDSELLFKLPAFNIYDMKLTTTYDPNMSVVAIWLEPISVKVTIPSEADLDRWNELCDYFDYQDRKINSLNTAVELINVIEKNKYGIILPADKKYTDTVMKFISYFDRSNHFFSSSNVKE